MAARAWLADDPDPADRAEIEALLNAVATGGNADEDRDGNADGDSDADGGEADDGEAAAAGAVAWADLADRFAGPLRFGTAGLRGPVRAGPNGMNTAVVLRAAAGLASWLVANRSKSPAPAGAASADARGMAHAAAGSSADPAPPSVVIGFDARRRSDAFALASARAFAGAGLRVLLLPGPLPTPVLAFAVRHLDADAGVMVTASHNPAPDNGYKVYLGGPLGDAGRGAQLVSPADEQIEAAIAAASPAARTPLADTWTQLGDEIVAAYVTAAAAPTPRESELGAGRDAAGEATAGPGPRIAYTPLHGVGLGVLRRVFAAAGLPEPVVVAEQAEPDPDFPTARFPNPEEPGVMERVLALGARIGADVVLANDPDADRLAVAVGGRVLTGDELGLLLADEILLRTPGPVASTVVSSTALRTLAARRGVRYAATLTGFKWIMRGDPDLVFGYEEALGYAVRPDLVRDKDGLTAAVTVARMAAAEAARGRTLLDRLDELNRELGAPATAQVSIRVPDLAASAELMRRLRATAPADVAGLKVVIVTDLLVSSGLPASDVLIFTLAGDARAVVRPSGTEPKLKIYLEATADRLPPLISWARGLA